MITVFKADIWIGGVAPGSSGRVGIATKVFSQNVAFLGVVKFSTILQVGMGSLPTPTLTCVTASSDIKAAHVS